MVTTNQNSTPSHNIMYRHAILVVLWYFVLMFLSCLVLSILHKSPSGYQHTDYASQAQQLILA